MVNARYHQHGIGIQDSERQGPGVQTDPSVRDRLEAIQSAWRVPLFPQAAGGAAQARFRNVDLDGINAESVKQGKKAAQELMMLQNAKYHPDGQIVGHEDTIMLDQNHLSELHKACETAHVEKRRLDAEAASRPTSTKVKSDQAHKLIREADALKAKQERLMNPHPSLLTRLEALERKVEQNERRRQKERSFFADIMELAQNGYQ
ncbi:hypothetical protein ABBQ38_011041 [Trebouxia sp. C0009 RCD-2024]